MLHFPKKTKMLYYFRLILILILLLFISGGVLAFNLKIGYICLFVCLLTAIIGLCFISYYYAHTMYSIDSFKISNYRSYIFYANTDSFAKSTIHRYRISQSPFEKIFKLYTITFSVFSTKQKLKHIDASVIDELKKYKYIDESIQV